MAVRPLTSPRPQKAVSPRLQVIAGSGRRRSPVRVIVLAVITVFGVAALQAYVGQDGLKVARLEREVHEEAERATLLRGRVAELNNPQRVAAEAAELELVADPNPVFIKAPVPPVRSAVPKVPSKTLNSPAP